MSNENTSIHDFDLNLICEYYATVERQGPGSKAMTKKALSFVKNLNDSSEIIDIGCGSGGQTITLAENTKGNITGLDLFPIFLEKFDANVKKHGFEKRMKSVQASMEDMPFSEESFDLIWSEGAIYNIGFEKGMKEWHKYLKDDGYIAVSEVSWLRDDIPDEIKDFWMDAYPEIDTISTKVSQMQSAGFVPVATFVLPVNCWTDNFYDPQIEAQKVFLEKNAGNPAAESFIANQRHEESLYRKYKDYYSYVFYIGKKI